MNIKIGLIRKYSPVLINLETAEMESQEVIGLLQRGLEQYRNGLVGRVRNE